MSSNNIYNILNTLQSLEPKEAPKVDAKPVYESVESKGSIMSGVSSIEQKLSEAYTAEKAKNPYAIGMAQAMKSTGDKPPLKKSTITKAHEIAKKVKETAPAEKLPADQLGLDKFSQAALAAHKRKLKREKNAFDLQNQMKQGMAEGVMPKFVVTFKSLHSSKPETAMVSADDEYDAKDRIKWATDQYTIVSDIKPARGNEQTDYTLVVSKASKSGPGSIGLYPNKGIAEGEVTKTATGIKHTGKYGTEYQGDADEEEAAAKAADKGTKKRGRPAKGMSKPKPAAGEKLGRGRPKKAAAPTYSGGKDLQSFFGSNPAKGKTKGTVHRMDEARIMDSANETLQHVLNRFKHEVKQFEQTGDLDNDLYEALFDYYMDAGEMPYGIAKARTGDPFQWVSDNLESYLGGGGIVSGNPPEDVGMEREGVEPAAPAPAFKPGDRVMYAGKFATIVAQDGDAYGIKVDGHPGTMMVPASAVKAPSYDEGMDAELNELAKLAGLQVEEAAKPDYIDLDKDGDKEETMKKAAKDAEDADHDYYNRLDDEQMDEGMCEKCHATPCKCNEGNAFGAAVAKAKSDGIQPGEKIKVGGKSYTVKEAEELVNMMRSAGLDTTKAEAALAEAKKYGDTDVEEAPEYANSPDEEIENVDAIIHQGNDLNREKKQYADKPKTGDNPMATAESFDPLAALGRKLMKAYESIKITK